MLKMTHAQVCRLVWTMSFTDTARRFGIRENQVAKAGVARDITRPQPGHRQEIQYDNGPNRRPLETSAYPTEQMIVIEASGLTAGEGFANGRADRRPVS